MNWSDSSIGICDQGALGSFHKYTTQCPLSSGGKNSYNLSLSPFCSVSIFN